MSTDTFEDVTGEVDVQNCNCLNEDVDNGYSNIFNDMPSQVLKSDADEQLLLTIPFRSPVKIQSLTFHAPNDESAPKSIKIFVNKPTMSFDDAENNNPTEEFELSREELSGEKPKMVKYVKYQNVRYLTIFVGENYGAETTTLISLHITGKRFTGLLDVNHIQDVSKQEEA